MKNDAKKPKTLSQSKYMPPEILTQILVTLPVKTLIRFRCVCKSWCHIIDEPDFIYAHLKQCKTNFHTGKLLSLEAYGPGGFGKCLLTIRRADTLRKTALIFHSPKRYYLYGSCNGLLLVARSHSFQYFGMRLCNPSVRKSLLLPQCLLYPCSSFGITFVLGFGRESKVYKVIAISFNEGPVPTEMYVAVYALSDQQWTLRKDGVNIDCLTFYRMFGGYYSFLIASVYAGGAAHWLRYDPYGENNKYSDEPTHLISLNFDTEEFTFLELPFVSSGRDASWLIFVLGESLAVSSISCVSISIWLLEQDNGKEVWTPWFSGPSSHWGFKLFKNRISTTKIFFHEGNGGYFNIGNLSYNIASCQVNGHGKSMSRHVGFEMYSESLVLFKGYGAKDANDAVSFHDDV